MNFHRLKATLSIEDYLRYCNLDSKMKRGPDRLSGPCPIHGGDNPGAFVVTPSKNLWYCFTRCREGGDLIKLAQRLHGLSFMEVEKHFGKIATVIPGSKESVSGQFKPYTRKLTLNPYSAHLENRGIRPETAALFEAGEYKSRGFMENCLVIRLHSVEGQPLGYAGRRLSPTEEDKWGKWKFPRMFPKSSILYNYYRIRRKGNQSVIITECPWGVMRFHQLGLPSVSLLGTILSTTQKAMLGTFSRVILALDGDIAGRKATKEIKTQLKGTLPVEVLWLPENRDPDELDDEQLKKIISPFFL